MKKLLYTFIIINYSLLIANCFSQWVQVSNGMGNLIVNALAYSGNNLYAGTNVNGVYLSTNNGANWTQTSLNSDYISSLAISGNNIFAGSLYNGVFLSTNNGTNWTLVLANSDFCSALAVNNNYVYAGFINDGLIRSTDNGASWSQIPSMIGLVRAFAVNGSTVFAGRDYASLMGVNKSTNNGTTWTQTPLNNRYIRALALNGNNVFAGTNNYGVYLSTDNGSNWNQSSLNTHFIIALAVIGNNVFAGAGDTAGVYVSNNNGTNWTQRNEGLSPNHLSVRTFTILNNYIYAGIYSGGVYRRPLSELTGIQPISNETPKQFSLSQNYPNPFNPKTVINFQVASSSSVKIIIFDALGREVEILVNEQLNAGTYEVDFDGTNYPSGVYYYKFTANDFVKTKKMILIK